MTESNTPQAKFTPSAGYLNYVLVMLAVVASIWTRCSILLASTAAARSRARSSASKLRRVGRSPAGVFREDELGKLVYLFPNAIERVEDGSVAFIEICIALCGQTLNAIGIGKDALLSDEGRVFVVNRVDLSDLS